jgi:hypothetical protein
MQTPIVPDNPPGEWNDQIAEAAAVRGPMPGATTSARIAHRGLDFILTFGCLLIDTNSMQPNQVTVCIFIEVRRMSGRGSETFPGRAPLDRWRPNPAAQP